jgi:probable rRNA maturation factor
MTGQASPRPAAPGRARATTASSPRGRGTGLAVTVTDGRGRALRVPGLAAWLRRVAPARARGDVAIALVSDARMRALNQRYRGAGYATDVLSFPAEAGDPPLGDLVIATGVAARQARAAGHSLATELKVLALHGLLHLLGHDHEVDDGAMARVEARLRRQGGLPGGLIERGAAPPRRPASSRGPAPAVAGGTGKGAR